MRIFLVAITLALAGCETPPSATDQARMEAHSICTSMYPPGNQGIPQEYRSCFVDLYGKILPSYVTAARNRAAQEAAFLGMMAQGAKVQPLTNPRVQTTTKCRKSIDGRGMNCTTY